MESINSFNGGMNSDVSKVIHSKDSYLQALNFRGITTLGESNGSLVNIKGNELNITLPEVLDSYKLIVSNTALTTSTTPGSVTIDINGQSITGSISSSSKGVDIYNLLIQLSNCYNNTTTPGTGFAVSYVDNYVVIYQNPVYTLGSGAPTPLTITITLNNPGAAQATIQFVAEDGTFSDTQVTYVSGASDLIVIGSQFIDEDIYLLSAVDDDTELAPHPNDSFSNLGVIWKLSIDNVTTYSTLTLIYANYLDFTKFYPVAPTAILGRYESKNLQRLYWTDFYNSIKTLNVTDEQLFALNPALTSVFPAVTFELPLLKSFGTGSLVAGTYELGYLLKKTAGQISNYSQTSNMVHLLGNEQGSFISYEGPTSIANTGRSITWTINNVDTAWDVMQFVVVYRATKTDLPIIYLTPEQDIVPEFTLTTVDTFDTILLEEFLTLSTGFTHAKTVETKDNILFWGNVKSVRQKEISSLFDARAFRAKVSGGNEIILKGEPPYADVTLAAATPKTNNSINEYYDATGEPSPNACYYRPGTTKLGGQGTWIGYEFGTENILLSELRASGGGSDTWAVEPSSGPGYSLQSAISTISPQDLITSTPNDSTDQVYPISGVGTAKNPYFTSVMKDFQHEEIYRFGIQFFDLQGGLYFTEWIGDIKMPAYSDVNDVNRGPQSIAAGITDFRNSFLYNNQIWGQTLYIKFDVDVTPIAEYISGYQIVRVERTETNKTILGTGMLTNTFVEASLVDAVLGGGMYREFKDFPYANIPPYPLGIPYNPFPSQDSLETLGHQFTSNNGASGQILTYDCFDFLTNNYNYQAGDKVLIRSRVTPINRQNAQASIANPRYRLGFDNRGQWLTNNITKAQNITGASPVYNGARYVTGFDSVEMPYYMLFYVEDAVSLTDGSIVGNNKPIRSGQNIAPGETVNSVLGGSLIFRNNLRSYGPQVDGTVPGLGSYSTLLTFETANKIDGFSSYGATASNGKKLMALYYRPNALQYGGNTYAARSNNEYIACGSLVPLNRDQEQLPNNKNVTFKCYGGDVHINYWDHQKVSKNLNFGTPFKCYKWDSSGTGNPGSILGFDKENVEFNIGNVFYFPCKNSNNQAVRFGVHADKDLTVNTFSTPDEFNYQTYHSNEKNVVKFIPKPFNFVINDEWRNRIYYSNVKFDNEIQDSWSAYPINQWYDVEGNYGGITSLIALNQNLYYIQEKGVGVLSVNPQAVVNDVASLPIQLGVATGIQKHYYRSIDSGSKHQWSVNRSQSAITYIDIRQKKIVLFNGETVNPISDTKGQRGFLYKRLHNTLINNDNPIIGRGLLVTYDYQNNEFLYTFKNNTDPTNTSSDENLTLAYSEFQDSFVSMYSFTPNIYINNNRYLWSIRNDLNKTKLYLHNVGEYAVFYDEEPSPSSLKLIVNEQPLYTKVFDNLAWLSESVDDNIEWSDDFNLYPGSMTNPAYPDNVNHKDVTFDKIRLYNEYQNTDWVTLTPGTNLRKVEQSFNIQIPRNKFNYDTNANSTFSIFDPARLTKTTFGERLRDKWLAIDLSFDNTMGLRFIIHNIKTIFRISDR